MLFPASGKAVALQVAKLLLANQRLDVAKAHLRSQET
jgi:hypothetical protein